MLTVYSLKACDTCRKALAALEASGKQVRVVDVRADGVPADALARLVADPGPEALVNRRSTTWRGLDEHTRAAAMTPETAMSVLAANPTLMKRPVIVDGSMVHVGWSPAVQKAVLG